VFPDSPPRQHPDPLIVMHVDRLELSERGGGVLDDLAMVSGAGRLSASPEGMLHAATKNGTSTLRGCPSRRCGA
jgi:hypothetical protein